MELFRKGVDWLETKSRKCKIKRAMQPDRFLCRPSWKLHAYGKKKKKKVYAMAIAYTEAYTEAYFQDFL